ncbi:MAG: PCRF domain-containing protein, partial [SAR202 cluster bacterium]
MLERLSSVEEKYEELNRLLADPEVVADYTKVQQYAKEQSVMREVVELAREYREVMREMAELREMLRSENDTEILAMAKQEQSELE